MTWRVWGERMDTADLSGTTKAQKFRLNADAPMLLLAIKTWIIFYNDPALTSLSAKIYSDLSDSPDQLLYTSAALTKAEMITLDNGAKEIYFAFNAPHGVLVSHTDWMHLVLSGSGYTGSSTSHIAWMKAWPNPSLDTGYTPTATNASTAPYFVSGVIAGEHNVVL